MTNKTKAIIAIVSIALIVAIAGNDKNSKGGSSKDTSPAKQETVIEDYNTSIATMYSLNELAAEKKYKGNLVVVSGVITEITKSLGSVNVVLEGNDDYNIQCILADEAEDAATNLVKGTVGTFKGRVTGELFGNIGLRDCVITPSR